MKIEMTMGCTSYYLGVDGKREANMSDEQKLATWKYVTQTMHDRVPKGDDLSQLLLLLLQQWGEWEYGDIACECCGDTTDHAVLDL